MSRTPGTRPYQQRLILPLGQASVYTIEVYKIHSWNSNRAREIEFTLPPPMTPPVIRRQLNLDGACHNTSNDSNNGNKKDNASLLPRSPDPGRLRSFSSAFLFPTTSRSSSPLLCPMANLSAPSSPLLSPSPSMCHSAFPSLLSLYRTRTPSPNSRSPSPSPKEDPTSPPLSPPSAVQQQDARSSSLGTINPELYKSPLVPEEDTAQYPEGHLGRVWFSLSYDRDQEKLQITVIQIRNLPQRDKDTPNSCDPLVRITLLPSERRYQQTSTQRKTCNPIFNEVFGFHRGSKELSEQTIKLTVVDQGRHRKRQAVGHLLYPLKGIILDTGKQQVLTEDLSKDAAVMGNTQGELHVSLCYYPKLDRLTVTILQARNIKAPSTFTPDTYVRLTLYNQTKAVKTKRTAIIRRSHEPCYNESFHFRLEPSNLDTSNISLAVHQADNKDRILGRLVLGSFMFARGRGQAHWNDMLTRPCEHIQRWHPLPNE